jgi:hypothetical protein
MSEELKGINTKRGRLIQLINYLTPIGAADYPIIVEKVIGMTEAQLDTTYAQLYKKFAAKAEEEQQTAKKFGLQTTPIVMPNESEFTKSSCIMTEQSNQPSHQATNLL